LRCRISAGCGPRKLLQSSGRDIPFILISGTVGEDMAVEGHETGGPRTICSRTGRRGWGKAVEQALQQKRLRDERKQAENEIKNQLRELQRWHEATLGREERILELKREGQRTAAAQNLPPRYMT